MRTIAFASFKGGVGGSLALANLAHYLATLGQRVIALDLDLESPGLHTKLVPSGRVGPPASGMLDVFEAFASHRPLPLRESLQQIRSAEPIAAPGDEAGVGPGHAGAIWLLDSGATRDGYWQRLAEFPWRRLLCGVAPHQPHERTWDGRGGEFLLTLQAELQRETDADYLLIDTPGGTTELGDLASSLLADDVVLLLAHNHESLVGTAALITALLAAPRLRQAGTETSPPRIFPALSRLPRLPLPREKALLAAASTRLGISGLVAVWPLEIIHCCPELAVHEQLVLQGAPTPPTMELLAADYLRLFGRIVPSPLLESDLRAKTDTALRLAFEDPDSAAATLDDLATTFPHPTSYRAVLKHLRLTRDLGPRAMHWVERLVALTQDLSEPLVFEVVKSCAAGLDQQLGSQPRWMELTEQVWAAHGHDWTLGLPLANALRASGEGARAHHVLVATRAALPGGSKEGTMEVLRAMLAHGMKDEVLDAVLHDKDDLTAP